MSRIKVETEPRSPHSLAPLSHRIATLILTVAAAAVPKGARVPPEVLAKLDAALAGHGSDAQAHYEQGRAQTRSRIAEYDESIASAATEAVAARLRVDRQRLVNYVSFPFDEIAEQILARLNE